MGIFGEITTTNLGAAIAIVATAVLLRRVLARAILRLARHLLLRLNLPLPPNIDGALLPATSAVVVCVGLGFAIPLLDFPEHVLGSLTAIVRSLIVVAIYTAASALLKPLETNTATESDDDADENMNWVASFARLLMAILAVGAILEIWGIRIGSALAGASVLGAAFALTLQDFVRDVVAGWSIRSAKNIKIGDWVEFLGGSGKILFLGGRTTRLRTWDQSLMIVPNQMLWNNKVVNWSNMTYRLILWKFGVPLKTSGDQLTAICSKISEFLIERDGLKHAHGFGPFVFIDSIGTSSIIISVEAYFKTPKYRVLQQHKDELARAIIRIVEANGSHLAVPVSEVRLDRTEGGHIDPPTSMVRTPEQ